MKNLDKMNNTIKKLATAQSTEDFDKIRKKIFKYRDKIMHDVEKEKTKMERKKQEMQRQVRAQKTKIKGKIRVLQQEKLRMQNSMMKKTVTKYPNKITFNKKK